MAQRQQQEQQQQEQHHKPLFSFLHHAGGPGSLASHSAFMQHHPWLHALAALAVMVVLLLLALPAHACCTHQGNNVQCPAGLPDGSMSVAFVSGGTSWQTPTGMTVFVPQSTFPACTPSSNGQCGITSGSVLSAPPSSANYCSSGTVGNVSTGSPGIPYTWVCLGTGGGSNAYCSAEVVVAVDGACGSADGSVVNATPSSPELCSAGNAGVVTTGDGKTTPWSWSCLGINGGNSASCSSKINALCGPASQTVLTANPPADSFCSAGTVGTVSPGTPSSPTWSWTCLGVAGGSNASCSSLLASKGACGPANGVAVKNPPATGLCANGTASPVAGTGPWSWSCTASDNQPVSCSAPLLGDPNGPKNGQCGPANGVPNATGNFNVLNLCNVGLPSPVAALGKGGVGPWSWTCSGSNGGANAQCGAPTLDGKCGIANGLPAAAPGPAAALLCTSGTASPVFALGAGGTGPFLWTCQGGVGGFSAFCLAPDFANGQCGPANGAYLSQAPGIASECNAGNPGPVFGVGPWSWVCTGAGGGANANCSANPIPAAVCGSANGSFATGVPSTNLCNVGTASTVIGTGPWNWTCSLSSRPSIVANCSTNGRAVGGNCLFNWLEDHYPTLLAPARPTTLRTATFNIRFYSSSSTYVAMNGDLFYLGPLSSFSILDLGPLTTWYSLSGCSN
jgi:hypothetical protein